MSWFDKEREADFLGFRLQGRYVLCYAVISSIMSAKASREYLRYTRDTSSCSYYQLRKGGKLEDALTQHDLLTLPLTPHTPDSLGRRTDEHQSSFLDSCSKLGTLG